jgi:hypothetical protein
MEENHIRYRQLSEKASQVGFGSILLCIFLRLFSIRSVGRCG